MKQRTISPQRYDRRRGYSLRYHYCPLHVIRGAVVVHYRIVSSLIFHHNNAMMNGIYDDYYLLLLSLSYNKLSGAGIG